MTKRIVIFVGAQGSGKTTQAHLLLQRLKSQGLDVRITSLSYYVIFQLKFMEFLKKASGTHTIKVKPYENLQPHIDPAPEMYKSFFGLLIALHLFSFFLSRIKQMVLRPFYGVIIEHEGYIMKEIADLDYLVNRSNINPRSITSKLLEKMKVLLLSPLKKYPVVIIYFEGQPGFLKPRYLRRSSGIEPSDYIYFQNMIYDKLISILGHSTNIVVIKPNPNNPISKVHRDILSSIPMIED